MAKTVDELLQEMRLLGDEQFQIVQAVRALVRKAITPVSEEVKYGGILFTSGVPFGGVFAYREHVSVEFGSGAKIADPDKVLEGQGKGRRHIKLRAVSDISSTKLENFLLLALEAARRDA